MSADDISDMVYQIVERKLRGVTTEVDAVVTSWDPKTHMAKVTLQPGGQETGWLQTQATHVGNGWGVLNGLTVGDQVSVRFQYGDLESGKVSHRTYDDVSQPPQVQSGEILLQHQKGGKVFFAQNGQVTIQDGGGGSIVFDGSGNVTITGGTIKINGSTVVDTNG